MTDINSNTHRDKDALIGALDMVNIGYYGAKQTSTIFDAILNASKDNPKINDLAEIGEHLSRDWLDQLDIESKRLNKELEESDHD